jgi:hypothetical protein
MPYPQPPPSSPVSEPLRGLPLPFLQGWDAFLPTPPNLHVSEARRLRYI